MFDPIAHPRATAALAVALTSVSPQLGAQELAPSRPLDIQVREAVEIDPAAPAFSATRIVVRFEQRAPAAQLDGLLRSVGVGARVAETGYDSSFEVLEVPAEHQAIWVDWLRQQSGVLYAEPDGVVYAYGNPPNDPFFGYQWHLFDQGYAGAGSSASNHGVNAPEAWTKSTGSGVVVAIIDTGVAYENYGGFAQAPDLANTSFVPGYDFVNNDAHANDDQGHGTHVAGTVAQSTNNSTGVAGVAYDCTIMPVKTLSSSGSGSSSWVASGIRFAADNGADVINMSLGSDFPSTVIEDAVNYAASRGVVICAATGNSGATSIGYPARYDACIAVGATRFDGARAPYSQRGTGIDAVAPGGDTSVDQNGDGYVDGVLQMTFGASPTSFGYYFFQGTSMATPHVAGVAALVKAADPSATAAEVRAAIESSCRDLGSSGYDTTFGHGLVDASAAVDAILGSGGGGGGGGDPAPGAPSGLAATGGNGTVALDWADNGEGDLAGYNVYRSTSSGGGYSTLNGGLVGGSSYTDNSVSNGVTYYYVVTAVDAIGQESAQSGEASATPSGSDTTPPAAPGNVSSSRRRGAIDVFWNANSEPDLAGYMVYRSTSSNSGYTPVTGIISATSVRDSSVTRRVRYYYRVTAWDTSGNESAFSNTTSQRAR